MHASVRDRYGGPETLGWREVPTPTPGPGEALVRVEAASVNALDWRLMRADPFLVRFDEGLRRPKHRTLGADVAGRVEALGPGVTDLAVGDAVFGDLSGVGLGAFAEFVAAPALALARRPRALDAAQAAALPVAGVTALQALREVGGLQPGERVLVGGASGGVGSLTVSIAAAMGARVTGLCRGDKADFVRSLGAVEVVDRMRGDITRRASAFDLIVDAGAFRPFGDYRPILAPRGRYVLVGGSFGAMLRTMLLGRLASRRDGHRFLWFTAKANPADLQTLADLAASGKVRPAIDRTFPLQDAAEAIRHLEAGDVRGKVVLVAEGAAG